MIILYIIIVVCFGTEDRITDAANVVAATTAVLPFVSFPGSEIKDLMVHEPTEAEVPAAPENTQREQTKPPAPPKQNSQRQNNQNQKPRDNNRNNNNKPRPTENQNQNQNQKTQYPPKAAQPQHAAGTGAHLMNLRERKGAGGDDINNSIVEKTDFDLQAALTKFTKVSINSNANVEEETEVVETATEVYVKDDFFDNLSCDVNDRSAGKPTRVTAKEERVLNQDTFGAVSLQNNYRGGRGGRGRGRGRGGVKGRGGGICYAFQSGTCDRGDGCRFSHDASGK